MTQIARFFRLPANVLPVMIHHVKVGPQQIQWDNLYERCGDTDE